MTRVLFSPHAIRTSEERKVESPVKSLLNEEAPLRAEPYKPWSQLKYPGGQGGPTEHVFSDEPGPSVPSSPRNPAARKQDRLTTQAQQVPSDSAPPSPCNQRIFGGPAANEKVGPEAPPSPLKTYKGARKHTDIFKPQVHASPLK